MKEETKSYQWLITSTRILFYVLVFIGTLLLFKYFQAELIFNHSTMPFEGTSTSSWISINEVVLNILMILLFFRMIIYSSAFNFHMREKARVNTGGQILIVLELIAIIFLNIVLFISGFYSLNLMLSTTELNNPVRIESFLKYHIFFIGELVLFISILIGVLFEFLEINHILRKINTVVLVLLLIILSILLAVPLKAMFVFIICMILTVILLYVRRDTPIRVVGTMLILAVYCIVQILMQIMVNYFASFEAVIKYVSMSFIVVSVVYGVTIIGLLIKESKLKKNKEIVRKEE